MAGSGAKNEIQTVKNVETFGYEIDADVMPALRKLLLDVDRLRDPSRNWYGLQSVKKLSEGEQSLTKDEKKKLLLISCDDRTDDMMAILGIDVISISPKTLSGLNFRNTGLKDISAKERDPLLKAIYDGESQVSFHPTREVIEMLSQKEAVVFVSSPQSETNLHKFVALLSNKFICHLIHNKHTFFGLGNWQPGQSSVSYDRMTTDLASKDITQFGQDFWGPA
jgi:hypothetical protein